MTQKKSEPNSQNPEIIYVPEGTDQVKCDGGGGVLGHPIVYYSFDGKTKIDCMYCDRCFIKKS